MTASFDTVAALDSIIEAKSHYALSNRLTLDTSREASEPIGDVRGWISVY
jgi:hypothetical protein